MAEEFSCNHCGVLSDTGYFYCPECHRRIKEEKQKEKENQAIATEQKENN